MAQFTLSGLAQDIYEHVVDAPIVSPHGHTDPLWFSKNAAFANPSELIITPDHYVFRMLYSQGISLESLGVGADANPRDVWRIFARHYEQFLGTPSRLWLDHMFNHGFSIDPALTPQTADAIYDQIEAALRTEAFLPRAIFRRFNIEVLATTDAATDRLGEHKAMMSEWHGRVIPTFRPDAVLDPSDPRFANELKQLSELTDESLDTFDSYLAALRSRRALFKTMGATATDHAIEVINTCWLEPKQIAELYAKVRRDPTAEEAKNFYGHMLIEMAQMSCEDGLVMQLHAGSRRNTNAAIMDRFGRDMGADIPVSTDWVRGLEQLLKRVGNSPDFTLILFTLDETTYARELAPMAGHWPCLRIGPPWWFHDSPAGIARYFDQVVETAGYRNLAGFNDDTRAFMSFPARHDLWRRASGQHLADQVTRGYFGKSDALRLAELLATDLARDAYKLGAA